jgi:hypothetical protein
LRNQETASYTRQQIGDRARPLAFELQVLDGT